MTIALPAMTNTRRAHSPRMVRRDSAARGTGALLGVFSLLVSAGLLLAS